MRGGVCYRCAVHLTTLIVQIGVILLAARLIGLLFRRLRQPQVMGEMVAGILLGPSLLGWLLPDLSAALFPPDSLGYLDALSQTGLLLFMFLVGLELDPELLRGRGRAAVATSHSSIVAPFLFGALLAFYLYPRVSDPSVRFLPFALFIGAAMSVTAFPVLARILTDRNLLRTKVGAIAIACAAVDDVTAWCLLAVVVGLVRVAEGEHSLAVTLLGSLGYVIAMFAIVRPALMRQLEAHYRRRGRVSQDLLAVVLLLVLLSAFITEWIGIHALFGAFLLGAILPKDSRFVHDLAAKLEDVTVVFLVPLFFAYAGLRTRIDLLAGADMWRDAAIILLVAIAGKFGGSALAARFTGLSWREAAAVAILMNTRGLMELVILTIGLDLGVVSPALFAMMVLMAIVTTFMTSPLLEWIYPAERMRQELIGEDREEEAFTVLIPVALPSSGPDLLHAAVALAPRPPRVYALHLQRASEQSMMLAAPPDGNRELAPILEAAARQQIDVRPLSFVSRDLGGDIVSVAHGKLADLILMGWHKPVISGNILGGTVAAVMSDARCDVVVYVQRKLEPWRRVLVPYRGGVHDRAAIALARQVARSPETEITILHVVSQGDAGRPDRLSGDPRTLVAENVRLEVVESDDPLGAAVAEARRGYDLVIIGIAEAWGLEPGSFGHRYERLASESPASLLIVRKYAG